jgi:hypothetical protein
MKVQWQVNLRNRAAFADARIVDEYVENPPAGASDIIRIGKSSFSTRVSRWGLWY